MVTLGKIGNSIPAAAVRTRHAFDAITEKDTQWRRTYAIQAIFYSAINAFYYFAQTAACALAHIPIRILTLNSVQLPVKGSLDNCLKSFYFILKMAGYLARNIINSKNYPMEFIPRGSQDGGSDIISADTPTPKNTDTPTNTTTTAPAAPTTTTTTTPSAPTNTPPGSQPHSPQGSQPNSPRVSRSISSENQQDLLPKEIAQAHFLECAYTEELQQFEALKFEVSGHAFKLRIPLELIDRNLSLAQGAIIIDGFELVKINNPQIEVDTLIKLLEDHDNFVIAKTVGNKSYLLRKDHAVIADLVQKNFIGSYVEPLKEKDRENILPQDLVQSVIWQAELLGSRIIQSNQSEEARPEPQEVASWRTTIQQWNTDYITGGDHPIKLKKYKTIVDQTSAYILSEEMKKEFTGIKKDDLEDACKQLQINAQGLLTGCKDERDQYKNVVKTLQQPMISATVDKTLGKAWLRKIAYHRFAEVKLYKYCKELTEDTSGVLSNNLGLDSFWEDFETRRKSINEASTGKAGLPTIARGFQKIRGALNVSFNPLASKNVPYIYGYMAIGKKDVTILRHGVPVNHCSPPGLGAALNWAFGTPPLEITADYLAFIEEAGNKKQNILHLILENRVEKLVGDESARVKARQALGNKYENFFPVVLQMDGEFFNKTKTFVDEKFGSDFSNAASNKINYLKKEITTEIKIGIDQKIRKKMRAQGQPLVDQINAIIDDVHSIYFKDRTELTSQEEYQAFILLSYVHFTHAFCKLLDISILEALCKDDKDRGGAFKAILTLDFLYRSNQLDTENLNKLMVNLLAAPLIITKDAMLEDRAILIKHVLDVMKKAPKYEDLNEQYRLTGAFNVAEEG